MTTPSVEARELAAAIRNALHVPSADTSTPGAEYAEDMLRLKRTHYVRGVLESLASGTATVAATASLIREATTAFPVTYSVRSTAEVAS